MSCFAQAWPTSWSCWICTMSSTPFTGSKPSQISTPQTRNPSENSRPRARWTKNYSRPWRWLWNVWRCISRWVLDSPVSPALFHAGTIFTFYFCLPLIRGHVTLTHWGRVTHICVVKMTIIGSDNGLSPGRRQAIIWTNAAILLIGPLGTNFIEILIGIQTFSLKKMHLKMSSAKWRPFCLGLNVLTTTLRCALFREVPLYPDRLISVVP